MTARPRKVSYLKAVNITRRNRMEANKVLRAATTAKLAKVTVIGFTDEGRIYMASNSDAPDCLWDISYASKWLLEGCPEEQV
tara:strand:+ start:8606 stop:8851 length:246 start_codon:yes stop_codon:yes gene_type:complete